MVFISPRTVSLGVDTFAGDPTSGFALHSDDYLRMGERLAAVGLPTVLVFEGGYAVDAVGVSRSRLECGRSVLYQSKYWSMRKMN